MKTTVYINVLILLGGIKTVVLGADDFTVEVTEPCYNDNDTVRLVVQYTGSGSPIAVRWKFSKMTDAAATLDVSIAFCLASAGADPAFPEARMSYSCDGAKKQYNVTISSFDALTDAGIWEAALSVSGSYTNFTSVSVTKCSSPTPGPIPDKCDCWWARDCDEDSWQCILCQIIRAFIICLLIVVGLILVGMVVAVILLAISESLNSSTSSDCCDCCDEEFVRCNKCKCCPCCNVDKLPHWYQILCCSIIGSPTAFGIYIIWRLKQSNGDVKPKEEKPRHETQSGNTRTGPKKPETKKNESKDSVAQIENEQHNQRRKQREQPPPPSDAGAATGTILHGREDSESAVSREHVHIQESGRTLPQRPMPGIPSANDRQGHDSKGRGLSATYNDEDHPLVAIDTPSQKKGALESLPEGTGGEGSVKKLKKKKKKSKDREDEM